jgi:hypothetical protein
LPLASFRFHVAMDTLALSYCYFCLHSSGLPPYRLHPCWAHIQKNRCSFKQRFFYYFFFLNGFNPRFVISAFKILTTDSCSLPDFNASRYENTNCSLLKIFTCKPPRIGFKIFSFLYCNG